MSAINCGIQDNSRPTNSHRPSKGKEIRAKHLMAQLLAIAQRHKKRADMQQLKSANITLNHGTANDFRGKPSQRQVTVLSREAWEKTCAQLDCDLPWTIRRANLLIEGIDLLNSSGQILNIGPVKLLITQETDPCERMEEAQSGLFKALSVEWRGGVCCRVLNEGNIQIGDTVEIINAK